MNCRPVWAKISSRLTISKVFSSIPFAARVAVAVRIAQQHVASAEQCEIDPPGVDAHAFDATAEPRAAEPQPLAIWLQSRRTSQYRPPAAATGAVLEAVQFFEREQLAVEAARQHTPTRGPQIDRQDRLVPPSFLRLRNFRELPDRP